MVSSHREDEEMARSLALILSLFLKHRAASAEEMLNVEF